MIAEPLGLFHRTYPGIDLHIVTANTRDIADLMVRHEIEIALVEGPVEDDNLVSEPWRPDVMSLIAGPMHRFASAKGPVDCRELEEEILIVREPGPVRGGRGRKRSLATRGATADTGNRDSTEAISRRSPPASAYRSCRRLRSTTRSGSVASR